LGCAGRLSLRVLRFATPTEFKTRYLPIQIAMNKSKSKHVDDGIVWNSDITMSDVSPGDEINPDLVSRGAFPLRDCQLHAVSDRNRLDDTHTLRFCAISQLKPTSTQTVSIGRVLGAGLKQTGLSVMWDRNLNCLMLTSKSIVTTILSMMTKSSQLMSFSAQLMRAYVEGEFIPLALRTVGSKSGITDTTQSLRQNSV